ncbi:MAG: 1-acyl-sn-glycerol-3-phosphate acyltransferase [Deltaproteobacteria bacterium]|nr:1-acyl-sn-glycerol-3-phosphate acyltransferase [Deltaproteobacteria bacterium]MBW2175478.1 1-acyl-sn-glycerol-3-phosphate acyltransferase [Deltaproteobacteria bacterium]MBW2611781.1 1-acyl-sn-glycerol-3-phosphate acyltransferase [Deltaproteobacteria bacterium]
MMNRIISVLYIVFIALTSIVLYLAACLIWCLTRLFDKRLMQQCESAITAGNAVYFFPEGTRSRDGRLKQFKLGAFILAQKMRAPILPIAINGSKNALPKNSINFHGRHHMRIEVLDEIPYADFANLSVEETAGLARERIAAFVDEHKKAV